ncbi:polymer-forming cytoskeletal protein [Salinarchaeum sp. IM2453]|uniref:bactofilin family protein n=1 Tax=Salinarchaeum sp. IM2453 TaxID=2862870 RepID=UPI001C837C34|nr:polymer-forming cytoskeletal protein [Salinarchaeum sp. IM2453]QZA88020.1 polymer-forming cytoskeletal protein [Salinarchaeum sp. IM2453]
MSASQRHIFVFVISTLLVVGLFPGVVSAQSGFGDKVTVESGENVSSVEGVFGTIIVEGTVTGDISGFAGDIVVRENGVVEGNIEAFAGSIDIAGTVRGDVSSGAGSVRVTETGVVEGDFNVGAGSVQIDGAIQGDARIGAATIQLGDTAIINGSLTYDGELSGNLDAVQGDITRDRSIAPMFFGDFQPVSTWVFAIGGFILNFFLGALLLGLFPKFSDRVSDRVETDPIRSGLTGLGILIGAPIILIIVALTVIGIPISIAGLFVFLLTIWIGTIYGRFAIGDWLLSLADVNNRWAALLAGLLLAAILWQIPVIGGLVNFIITLLGLGALVLRLITRRRRMSLTPGPSSEGASVE